MTTYEFLEGSKLNYKLCVAAGKDYYAKVLPAFKRKYGDRAVKIIRGALFTCMASDNYLTAPELCLLEEVLGFPAMRDVTDARGLSNYNTYEARDMYKNYCAFLNKEERTAMLGLMGVAVLCDGQYSRADADIIDHVLGYK